MSSRIAATRTFSSRSRASSSHGETLPSWSSCVTTISSPASSSRPTVRLSAKLSVVMFAPKTTSSGEQPRNAPPARRDSSTSSSVRRLVEYGPLTFAFEVRR